MSEHKLFTTPQFHDKEFYFNIEVAKHWDQPGHGERLRMTFVRCAELLLEHPDIATVADWGCGNGRLLEELQRMFPNRRYYGCDLLPANVKDAQERGVAIDYHDFVNEVTVTGNLVILTEVLEHLIDPHALLRRLAKYPDCHWIVASSPANETKDAHYEFHSWVWTDESYCGLFMDSGWTIDKVQEYAGAQIVVACR